MKNTVKILFVGLLMLVAAVAINAGDVLFQDGGLNVSQDLRVSTNALYVNSASGLVGIGTTSPGSLLTVAGQLSLTTLAPNAVDGDILVTGHFKPSGTRDLGGSTAKWRDLFLSGDAKIDGNVGIGTTSPTRTLHVSGNANITGNLAYGSLTQNSPNLIWTEKAFVTCAKAIDGRWYVEYVDGTLNTIREWVDVTNTAWQQRECYEKIQTTSYYFSLSLNESSIPKPENLYFDWNDMGVHVRQPVNQTI